MTAAPAVGCCRLLSCAGLCFQGPALSFYPKRLRQHVRAHTTDIERMRGDFARQRFRRFRAQQAAPVQGIFIAVDTPGHKPNELTRQLLTA